MTTKAHSLAGSIYLAGDAGTDDSCFVVVEVVRSDDAGQPTAVDLAIYAPLWGTKTSLSSERVKRAVAVLGIEDMYIDIKTFRDLLDSGKLTRLQRRGGPRKTAGHRTAA